MKVIFEIEKEQTELQNSRKIEIDTLKEISDSLNWENTTLKSQV